MVMDVNYNYCGDHLVIYTHINHYVVHLKGI